MKRWFLFLLVALLSVTASAEDELMVQVYLNNGQCDSYLRSNVKSISYESTDENPSEVSIMRLCVIMTEDNEETEEKEEKEVLIDYPLADVERVDFKPPYVWLTTRANVSRKYTQAELRVDIGGNWKDWPGVKMGFFIGKSIRPYRDEDCRVVYVDEVCDGPGQYTYWAKNSQGYVGKVYYHYQAFASYKGEFFLVGEPQSFHFMPVTMWTDTFAKLEKEDDEGHYYVAHVSADIFGDTREISSEMAAGRAEVGFCYGPNEVPTRAKGATLVPGWITEVGDLECDIPHLEANKKVWVRPYTIIADTIYYGLDFSIMTEPWVKVITDEAHDVEITSAKVNFHIQASAEEAFKGKAGIQFSTTPDLDALGDDTYHDIYDWKVDGPGDFTGYFTKLIPNTTYYCRAYLMANGKRYLGNKIEFTTKEEGFYGELGLFELKGHVKSCEWTNAWGTNTRTFDQNGFWLTGDGWSLNSIYPYGIKRDSKGRIIEGYYDEGGAEFWTIDEKGRKKTWTDALWDGGETHTYYYNENDMVYKETVEYIGLDVEWNEGYTVYYSDWVYDSQGNWVKRSAHSSTYGDSQESRKIIYY
jgi:hypothetical protein